MGKMMTRPMTGVAGSFLGLRQRSAFHRTAAVFAAAGDVGRCGRAAPGAGDCLTGCGCGPVLQGVHHKPPHQPRLAFRIWCRFASLIPVLQIFAKNAFPIRVTGAKNDRKIGAGECGPAIPRKPLLTEGRRGFYNFVGGICNDFDEMCQRKTQFRAARLVPVLCDGSAGSCPM